MIDNLVTGLMLINSKGDIIYSFQNDAMFVGVKNQEKESFSEEEMKQLSDLGFRWNDVYDCFIKIS